MADPTITASRLPTKTPEIANTVVTVSVAPSATPVPQPPIRSKFVKKGSYGCVVRPALPNKNERGIWREYPHNITKIYTNSTNVDKAIRNSDQVQNIMGANKGIAVHRYSHPYTVENMPVDILSRCGNIGEPHDDLYAVRQADLGIDIYDFVRLPSSSERIAQLRRLPIVEFLKQVRKLFQQVQGLIAKKYIHGDIRETNVLINPETGNLTIIDFDWLYPADIFFKKYPVGTFYANPPESLLYPIYNRLPKVNVSRNTAFVESFNKKTLESYLAGLKGVGFGAITEEYLLEKVFRNLQFFKSMGLSKDAFTDILRTSFDSWGLALTLRLLVAKIWPEVNVIDESAIPIELKPIRKLFDVLSWMTHFEYSKRMTIIDAYTTINKLITRLETPGFINVVVHNNSSIGAAGASAKGGRTQRAPGKKLKLQRRRKVTHRNK